MSTIYDDFTKLRNETRDIASSKEVLRQLIYIAFDNDDEPDTLPDVFYINNVRLNTSELEQLMEIYGIDAKIDMVYKEWVTHMANFRVTKKS